MISAGNAGCTAAAGFLQNYCRIKKEVLPEDYWPRCGGNNLFCWRFENKNIFAYEIEIFLPIFWQTTIIKTKFCLPNFALVYFWPQRRERERETAPLITCLIILQLI